MKSLPCFKSGLAPFMKLKVFGTNKKKRLSELPPNITISEKSASKQSNKTKIVMAKNLVLALLSSCWLFSSVAGYKGVTPQTWISYREICFFFHFAKISSSFYILIFFQKDFSVIVEESDKFSKFYQGKKIQPQIETSFFEDLYRKSMQTYWYIA